MKPTLNHNKTSISDFQKGMFCAILGAVFWGLSGVCGEYLLNHRHVDTMWVITNRMFYAGILLLIWITAKKGKKVLNAVNDKKDVLRLFVFAFFGLFICQATFYITIYHTNAGTATILQYLGPTMILIYYSIIKRQWPQKKECIAILLSIAGTYMISTHMDPSQLAISPEGLFWGILSAAGLASYNIISIPLTDKHGVMPIVGWGFFIGGFFTVLFTGNWGFPTDFTIEDYLAIGFVVVFGTVLPFTIYLYGVRLIGAVRASIVSCFEPVAAILFSFLCLNTTFHLFDLIGAAVILSSIILLSRKKAEK